MNDRTPTTLSELLKEFSGSLKTGPFGTALKAAEYSKGGGVPIVSVGEVGYGTLRIGKSTPRVGDDVLRRLPEYVLRPGDIVFGRKGAVDRCGLVREDEGGYFLGSDGIRLRVGTGVDPEFLTYQLQSSHVRNWLIGNSSGTTMASLNQEILGRVPINLPTLAEQRRVSEALRSTDDLIVALERLIAKKHAIKQGMMQQLLSGKTHLSGFDAPWGEAQLGSLLSRPPRYGINAAAVPASVGAHTYIRITDIDDSGRFAPRPKVGVRHRNVADYTLQAGELVFARTGASVGKSYLYDPQDGQLVYAGFLINLAPDPEVLEPKYLALFAQTTRYWDWVARTSVRSGQPGINGREYAQMQIMLPEIREQRAIAVMLQDVDAEIRMLGDRLDKARDVKQGMMQQLLTGRTRLPLEAAS